MGCTTGNGDAREDGLGQNKDNEQMEALQHFIDQGASVGGSERGGDVLGLISEVLGVVKSGKEATVYLCTLSADEGLVAAKVYRSTQVRQFANAAAYGDGRMRGVHRRDAVAMTKKSKVGREMSFGRWVSEEYATLTALHAAGVAVPKPIAMSSSVIIMEYIGDEDAPATPLAAARMDHAEAERVFGVLMRNVEMMLACDRVHGDLSAYNVLYRDGDVRIIDFPQAVDARFNSNALSLLERDIENLCGHFARLGVHADGYRIARGLWARFLRSEL
jgi:RIO kinase 1